MKRQFPWFPLIIIFGIFWCIFFVALTNSKSGEVAQSLANLIGAGIGGALAVIAGQIYLRNEAALRAAEKDQEKRQRLNSGRIILIAEVKIVTRQCKYIFEIINKDTTESDLKLISTIHKQIDYNKSGIFIADLTNKEIVYFLRIQDSINKLHMLYNNYTFIEIKISNYKKLIDILTVICDVSADFIESSSFYTDEDNVDIVNRLRSKNIH